MLKVARILLKNTFKKWWDMDPFREGAIIAYYSIFALPGLLVVIVSGAGYFFGAEAVSSQVYNQISDAMGKETATQVKEMMQKAAENKSSIWATIIGLISILVGATAVFTQLQKSMNSIWGVVPSPNKTGIWTLIRVRVFSFGLIVSIAFLLLVSLVVTSVLSALGSWVQQHWSDSLTVIFIVLHFLVSIGIITVLFALLFKVLPDVIIPWKQIWIGAFVTAFLFVLGKYALGLYFGKADPASGYGAAGSVVLILLWTSYSSMIVFLGNMFTKVYADHFQEEIHPSPYAIKQK